MNEIDDLVGGFAEVRDGQTVVTVIRPTELPPPPETPPLRTT